MSPLLIVPIMVFEEVVAVSGPTLRLLCLTVAEEAKGVYLKHNHTELL